VDFEVSGGEGMSANGEDGCCVGSKWFWVKVVSWVTWWAKISLREMGKIG